MKLFHKKAYKVWVFDCKANYRRGWKKSDEEEEGVVGEASGMSVQI